MLRFLVLELYQVSRARTRAQRYLYQFFQSVHQELQHALNTNSSTGQKRRKLAFRAQISLRGINTKGMNKKGKEPQPFPLRTHAPARMGGINTQSNGLRQGCLCLLYNGRKCRLVMHSQISQNTTVQADVSLAQSGDQTAVAQTTGTGSGVDTHDPERTELTLLLTAVAVSVLTGLDNGLFGYTKYT